MMTHKILMGRFRFSQLKINNWITQRSGNHLRSFSILASTSSKEDESGNNDIVHPYKSLFPWKSKQEFYNFLLTQIVHQNDGLVVINKPFGVSVTTQSTSGNAHREVQENVHFRGIGSTDYTLEGSLRFLKEALNMPELILVKSTERMTSGISVFAENEKYAENFKACLHKSKSLSHVDPIDKYRIISAATPFSKNKYFHETVGIKLMSNSSTLKNEPVIERNMGTNEVKRGTVRKVFVGTTILKYGEHNTTLLEIKTRTIKWNFLRVYCADILIPILGDHLYSGRIKTILGIPTKVDFSHSPSGSSDQMLSPDLLNTLNVRNSNEVPPHMHLSSYSLHNYIGRKNHLILNAPVPRHFAYSQERLNLPYAD